MAGGRVYSSNNSSNTNNNLSVLFQKQRVPNPPSSDPLFIPGSFFVTGTRSMVSSGDVNGSFLRRFDEEENGDDDLDEYFHQPEKKRRLTVDQVQFLEKSFEVENKLEPERKIQLAKDLGLQPRQVAIWFQNRRARWKTKQLEKDYENLQASFNSLKADYDNLLKDKEKLNKQVLQLTNKLIMKETVNSDMSRREPPEKPSEVVVELVCKQEGVMSSSKSDIFDSDSPYYTDGVHSSILEAVDSSYPFQSDHSDDVTQDEELHPASYIFPKLEDDDYSDPPASSCNYGFHVEDHAFWSSAY